MTFAVVRIRGTVNVKPDIKRTLQLLRLTRANHCVLLEENASTKGMLQVAKDYITWGEIDKDVLSKLIKSRGMLEGDKDLTDEQRQDEDLIAGCVGGALLRQDYIALIKKAGFEVKDTDDDKDISKQQYDGLPVLSLKLVAIKP